MKHNKISHGIDFQPSYGIVNIQSERGSRCSFLDLEYLQVFVAKVVKYRAKYGKHPSVDVMMSMMRTELDNEDEVTQKQVREYFARIHSTEVSGGDYIKETALDFCRKQKLKEAMMKSVGLLQSSSFDEISQVINDALKLGSENNFGYDYMADFEARFMPKHRNPVSTGWADIDVIIGGGLGKSELGVVIATSGPGATNLISPLANALMDSTPILAITGQVASTAIGNDAFQEAYTVGLTMAATKHNYLITKASEIPKIIQEAKFIATTGRPGPVLVDIPKDILNEEAEWIEPELQDLPGYKPTLEANPKMIQQAVDLIINSKKPVLYVGGGIIHSKANK